MTVNQQISPSALRAYKATKYVNGNPQKMLLEAKKAKRITSQFMTKGGAKAAAKRMKLLKKTVKDGKGLLDTLLKKVPGGTGAAKAGRLSQLFGILAGVAGATLVLKLNEALQNAQEIVSDRLSADISKTLSTVQLVKSKLDTTNKKVDELKLQDQRTRDRVFSLEKQLPDIKKSGNDALYEVRKGREILEGKISESKKQANDALYETRQGRKILDEKIDANKKLANDNLYEIRQGRQILEGKISATNNRFDAINEKIEGLKNQAKGVSTAVFDGLKAEFVTLTNTVKISLAKTEAVEKKVDGIPPTIISIRKELEKIKPDEIVATTIKYVDGKIEEIKNILRKDIQPKIESQGKELEKVGGVTVTTYEGVSKSLRDTYNLSFEAGAAKWNEDIRAAQKELLKSTTATVSSNLTTTSAQTAQQIDKLRTEIKTDLSQQTKELEKVKTDLEKTKQAIPTPAELNNIKIQTGNLNQKIPQLEKDIKDQKKVNDAAIPKLDDIVSKLGFIPALTANAIRPDIPTLPAIEAATGTAMCKSMNGGCSGRKIDDAVGNINNNTNNNVNNALDALNTGANAVQLGMLTTINNKLGDQLPGGLAGKLTRFSKWLHLDRVLNLMILGATVHNAMMLSNDLGQTLLGIVNNVLQLIGLKDDNGEAFNLGEIISSGVENFIKGVVGTENYTALTEAFAKANRIYQATTNVLNSFLNLSQTILQASELIAAYTGKIGNALKKGGVILENAYGWMNPQPKFNRVTQTLEALQNGASTIQMVTQAPLDVINATTELTTASTEFVKAVKEDDKPQNKAVDTPEPDELKAKESQAQTDSQPFVFDFSDLFDGED
jgi:hypothetical protein